MLHDKPLFFVGVVVEKHVCYPGKEVGLSPDAYGANVSICAIRINLCDMI